MTQGTGPWTEIQELAETIPYDGNMTHAEWGRQFADILISEASDDAIKMALADFGEVFISKRFTDQRRTHREMSRQIARGKFNGHTEEMAMKTLDLPIGVPGSGTRPLGAVNCWWIKGARQAIAKQRDGLDANDVRLAYYELLTAEWPDDPVATLVADGRITLDALRFPGDEPPALHP